MCIGERNKSSGGEKVAKILAGSVDSSVQGLPFVVDLRAAIVIFRQVYRTGMIDILLSESYIGAGGRVPPVDLRDAQRRNLFEGEAGN